MKLKGAKTDQVIILDDVSRDQISKILLNLSASQRFALITRKYLKIGLIQKENCMTRLTGYLFKCSKHGYQITYPSGFRPVLKCPTCIRQNQLDYYRIRRKNNRSSSQENLQRAQELLSRASE
jgi:hypothetical protein